MRTVGESCGAQTAEAKEAPSTAASVLDILERGAEALTQAFGRNGRRRSVGPLLSAGPESVIR